MKQIIAGGKLYIVCNVCKYKQGWLLKFAKILFCISYKQFHCVEFLQLSEGFIACYIAKYIPFSI